MQRSKWDLLAFSTLFAVFNIIFPAILAVAVELIHHFSSVHCYCLLKSPFGVGLRGGTTGNMVLLFPVVFFLVFLLDWFMFVGCVKELKLIIIDLIFEMS